MYGTDEDVKVSTYADLWQKGRYRVELAAELACEPNGIDKALEQLGYEIIDADQWGRSYWHNQDHNKTIELDELEDPTALVRLILRYGDLDEVDIGSAEEQLASLYARIHQMCRDSYDDNDYDCLCQPASVDVDQYHNLYTEQFEKEKLTYDRI